MRMVVMIFTCADESSLSLLLLSLGIKYGMLLVVSVMVGGHFSTLSNHCGKLWKNEESGRRDDRAEAAALPPGCSTR